MYISSYNTWLVYFRLSSHTIRRIHRLSRLRRRGCLSRLMCKSPRVTLQQHSLAAWRMLIMLSTSSSEWFEWYSMVRCIFMIILRELDKWIQYNTMQYILIHTKQSAANNPSSLDNALLLGAHFDSNLESPGACDNSMGTSTLLEILTVSLNLYYTILFHIVSHCN